MTTTGMRILVIEDEPAIADTLVYALRTEGFVPEWRATGRDGLAALDEGRFALVILDVGLPDMSGFDLCRELKVRTPVLFLTARSSEVDRIVGLELGADDYVTKPFSPREVTARVRAILRRVHPGSADVSGVAPARGLDTAASESGSGSEPRPSSAAFDSLADALPTPPVDGKPRAPGQPAGHLSSGKTSGPADLRVDVECRSATFRGVRLELARYEFRLLAVLYSRPGRVWSRDELMARAWEDPGSSLDRTVDAHIKTLRGKLRVVAPDADPIQTHRGEGYSLRLPS